MRFILQLFARLPRLVRWLFWIGLGLGTVGALAIVAVLGVYLGYIDNPFRVRQLRFAQAQLEIVNGTLESPTSLQFGPDGRLYVVEFFGESGDDTLISGIFKVLEVERTASGAYRGRIVETIAALTTILNHQDDGTPRPDLVGRLVTGFFVAGTAGDPVIYATSSDPRTSNALGGGDVNVDTNSGMLSRLAYARDASGAVRRGSDGAPVWEKVDLVRGFPRSEERHNINGVTVYVEDGHRYALISNGGNTNAGAPGEHFGWLPDYAYSGAVNRVDLDAVDALPTRSDATSAAYKHDLPTVDDPTRPGDEDVGNGPFGGNDGRNMARITSDGQGHQVGPVQIYATGIRNGFDILRTRAGQVFIWDNGGDPDNGGPPLTEMRDGRTVFTNRPNQEETITANRDQLHMIEQGRHYGHPNALRASGAEAGLFVGPANEAVELPADLDLAVPADLRGSDRIFKPEEQGRFEGEAYNAFPFDTGAPDDVVLSSESTDGLTEYVSAVGFGGKVTGDIFAVRWANRFNELVHTALVDTDGDGKKDAASKARSGALDIGATYPLDVTAWPQDQDAAGHVHPLAGTLWVAAMAGLKAGVIVLTPEN